MSFFLLIVFLLILVLFVFFLAYQKNLKTYISPLVKQSNSGEYIKIVLGEGFKYPGIYEVPVQTTYFDIITEYENIYNPNKHTLPLTTYVKDGDNIVLTALETNLQITQLNDKGSVEKTNINQATKEELLLVKGVGLKTADLILKYINDNSPVSSVSDLINIKGVGEKTIIELEKYFY